MYNKRIILGIKKILIILLVFIGIIFSISASYAECSPDADGEFDV
jgi:hypothetical protein